MPYSRAVVGGAVAVMACVAVTAGAPATGGTMLMGERKALGDGTVVAWVRMGASNAPAAVGVTFDRGALADLGTTDREVVLALPPVAGLPARNAVVDWNPHGHPPAHVYDVPHFDVHLYTLDEGARMAISRTSPQAAVTPTPDLVPTDFQAGATVPMMGQHYSSLHGPEFNGGTFTQTPIVGYWDGHLAFVEAMMTLAYLETHPRLTAPFPQPPRREESGWYPTSYGINFDPRLQAFTVSFSTDVSP